MSKKQESIATVTGKVGELGPHVIKADHTIYDYIRMDVDGQITMVRNVRVSQTIDSYLQPELDVTLYVHGGDKQGNNGLVVGAEIDGKKIVIDDDLNSMIEGVSKQMRKLYICIGVCILPAPILPLFTLLGIPIVILILMVLILLFMQKRKIKGLREEVIAYFGGQEQPA